MKVLKFILIALAALTVLALVALFIFIKTFDLNKYLPEITKSASEAMGSALSIERADLNVTFKGIVLDCTGIRITSLKPGSAPFVEVQKAHAGLELAPFIFKQKIDFNNIEILDIRVNIDDPKAPIRLVIPKMNARVNNFSLTEPYSVGVDFVFASDVENMHADALVRLNSKAGQVIVSEFKFRSDLSQINMSRIKEITPALAQAVLPVSISGDLTADVTHLAAGAKGLEGLQAKVTLEDAGANLKELLTPITKARVEADINLNTINIIESHLHINEGAVTAQGQIKNYMGLPQIILKGNIEEIKIEDIIDQAKQPVVLKGKIVANGNLTAQGFNPEVFLRSLKGQGEFSVNEGVIEKLNILKTVLGPTLNLVPGLADSLDSLITGGLKEKFGADATLFENVQGRFTVEDSVVYLDEAMASTKAFELNAKGTVGLNMKTDVLTSILLSKDISDDLSKKVEQLGYLRDESNRIKIGGQVSGVIPSIKFMPNVEFKNVAKNAILDEGSKQLEKVIEKNPEVGAILDSVFGGTKSDASADPDAPAGDSKDKAKKAINSVLNSIFK